MKGYYSIIQYCPDRARLEVANVGVVISVPELQKLEVRVANGNDRIRRFFQVAGPDLSVLQSLKTSFRQRVLFEQDSIESFDDLQRFISTRANDFVLSPPRSMRVENIERDADELFDELVGGRTAPGSLIAIDAKHVLRAAFSAFDIAPKIVKSPKVHIPNFYRKVTAPFAYQNGALNLIKPQQFGTKAGSSIRAASELAIESDMLSRLTSGASAAKLIVVSDFRDTPDEDRADVEHLFAEYRVDSLTLEQLPELVDRIRRDGHAIERHDWGN